MKCRYVGQSIPSGRLRACRLISGGQSFAPERTREILQQFADRAFRHPASKETMDRLMALVQARRRAGHGPFQAFKDGLKAALCSPEFLYLTEPGAAGVELSAHALVARLSYFLCSSLPDMELRQLADSGQLLNKDVLVAQARRMFASQSQMSLSRPFSTPGSTSAALATCCQTVLFLNGTTPRICRRR